MLYQFKCPCGHSSHNTLPKNAERVILAERPQGAGGDKPEELVGIDNWSPWRFEYVDTHNHFGLRIGVPAADPVAYTLYVERRVEEIADELRKLEKAQTLLYSSKRSKKIADLHTEIGKLAISIGQSSPTEKSISITS